MMKLSRLFTTIIAVLFASSFNIVLAGSHGKTYTMTVTDAESMEEMVSEWGPLAEALASILNAEMKLIQVASHTGAAEAVSYTHLTLPTTPYV